MQVNVEYEQLQEMLDLKKIDVIKETMSRLQREVDAYHRLCNLTAWAKSQEVTDELGLTVTPEEGQEAPEGGELSTVQELAIRRRKLMEAMRATIYSSTNSLKQFTEQGREAFRRQRKESEETPKEEPQEV